MLDNRNIVDKFKNMSNTEIKNILDNERFNYSVVCCNLGNDFNIGSIMRSANAFGAKEFCIYGKRKYDRRSSLGCQNYIDTKYFKDIYELREYAWKNDTLVLGVEQDPASIPYNDYVWKHATLSNLKIILLFGSEDYGLKDEEKTLCDHLITIPQYGSVRSLNVATAAGIIMSHLAEEYDKLRPGFVPDTLTSPESLLKA